MKKNDFNQSFPKPKRKGIGGMLAKAVFSIAFFLAFITVSAQDKPISLNAQDVPLKVIFRSIEKQSGYNFLYSSTIIDDTRKASINVKNAGVKEVFDILFSGTNIRYKIVEKQIILSTEEIIAKSKGDEIKSQPTTELSSKEQANGSMVVKGVVKDSKGNALLGVTILEKGTTNGAPADFEGKYTLKVSSPNAILIFSFIGYETQEVALNGRAIVDVTLNEDSELLEELVVTGYQTISKERATGSFTVLTKKDLKDKLQTNIMDRLEGQVAGLSSYKGIPIIRGTSTIEGETNPLYVVDGIPYEGSIDAINPSDIVNITILKDATAASIYGARSSNGVIVITTKSGAVGKTTVSYNGSTKLQGLPDRGYANKMSSSQFVDYQRDIFNLYPIRRSNVNAFQNDVQVLLLNHKSGLINNDQLEAGLNFYRSKDRYNEVVDEFLRKNRVTQQHSLSFGGGTEVHSYNVSVNYMNELPYEREQSKDRLGFNLKNTFNFFKWMRADVGIIGSNVSEDYDNGVSGMSMLNTGMASYYTLKDENGNPKQWYNAKSQAEIDRLNGLGLLNETYIPLKEMAARHYTAKSNYLNLNLGVTFKLMDGLNAELHYQNEKTQGFEKQYDTKDYYKVKQMINDATVIQPDGSLLRYIPLGGQILKNEKNSNSFTMRAQVNYSKMFRDVHKVQIIAGAEKRKVVNASDGYFRLGYDDETLVFSPFDELALSKPVTQTQSQTKSFYYSSFRQYPTIYQTDDRYLSYYANASYTFNQRITATASIRTDQSNLFGTDIRDQFKPLWSVGLQYVILENKFGWLNRLVGRATYGINGNVAKLNGPFLIVKDDTYNNNITNENQSYIQSPPNPSLRWERTAVTNFAVDFNLFKIRLSGSVEYYNKNTTDLLGNFSLDPTSGWTSLLMNFGSMYNRGIELTLNSINIDNNDFKWTSGFVFGYNKNKITKVESGSESALDYYYKTNIRKGYPMDALFSIRYAGLDVDGLPKAYKKDGTITKNYDELTKKDLVYSGTVNPPYNASLTNSFSYKGFDFSFMLVYYGGNVMRDIRAGSVMSTHPVYYSSNRDKEFLNYWKKPGDELDPNVNPAFLFGNPLNTSAKYIWGAADKHIQKGDYIKLRDLTLGYTLPSKLLKNYFIQSLRVNVQIQNLWKWVANDSGLDPEVWSGSNLTPSRGTLYPATYTFGLSINF